MLFQPQLLIRSVGNPVVGTLLVSICSIGLLGGCGPSGPKLYPVKGKVEIDGSPAANAIVFMHRQGRDSMLEPLPYGTADSAGNYEVETPNFGKGAQEGEYTLTVFAPDMSKPEDSTGQRPDLLNGAYEKLTESTLRATVSTGQNTLPVLKLTPGKPKPRAPEDKNLK